jgi:hypothetical protein
MIPAPLTLHSIQLAPGWITKAASKVRFPFVDSVLALYRTSRNGLWMLLTYCVCILPGSAHNVVSNGPDGPTAPVVQLNPAHASEILDQIPGRSVVLGDDAEFRRVADRLDAQVGQVIDGWPWMPFHHTHGISGYQTFFEHPDGLFHALAGAIPYLTPSTAERTGAFLRELLPHSPPFAIEGWDIRTGQPRESYSVPINLRLSSRGQARSAFGVYAFWAYCHFANDSAAAKIHWPAIQRRMQPLLDAPYPFQIEKRDYTRDEARLLNGDLAGLIGFIRLSRLLHDLDVEQLALPRLVELLELRVNLERANPRLLDRSVATRTLHLYHLARYDQLTPEIAYAIRRWGGDLTTSRLRMFRELRPAWWLAFGDRMVGGENYTNPPHFTHALFAAATLLEQIPASTLVNWLDVPWCKADLYFIERCILILRAAQDQSAGKGQGVDWKSQEQLKRAM